MTPSLRGTTPGIPAANLGSPWRWLLLVLALAPVLAVTLMPAEDQSVVTRFALCVICGGFGTANLIRNVVLFVPLGAAFALLLGPGRWALIAVFAVTATIETVQFHVPGRNPMVADLVANFVGGALSVGAVRWASWWLAPARVRGAALSLGAAAAASGVLLGTAWLFTVDLPRTTYWGQWTPNLAHLARYEGRLLSASVGGIPAWSRRLETSEDVRSALLAEEPVRVRAEAGPPPGALAPIFSIYDEGQREILLIGALRDDLVGRVRYRAHRLRLDRPDLRIPGTLRDVAVGDTVDLEFRVAGGNSCLTVDGRTQCGLGPRAERGWSLLKYLEGPPEWFRRLLDFGWMLGLMLPFGFFARGHSLTYVGAVVLVGGIFSGWWLAAVAPPTLLGLGGASGGILVGMALGRLARETSAGCRGEPVGVREHAGLP